MKIGVIGRGFVGGSVEKFLKEKAYHEVLSYDLKDGTDMNIAYERIVTSNPLATIQPLTESPMSPSMAT